MARLSRRALLIGSGTAVVAAGAAGYAVLAAGSDARVVMTPPEVLEAVQDGRVLLVDVRRPDEWQATGLAQGAVPIDMRRPDFVEAVLVARRDAQQPIAIICARGVRSRRMTAVLTDAGLKPIIDVPEGMLGSFAGPGWLARELPLQVWSG